MTTRVRTLALDLALDRPTRRRWLSLSLSVLCFIHCVAATAVVPLLPAAFAFLTESESVEWVLVAVAAALAARLLWSERSFLGRWRLPLWGTYAVVSAGGGVGLLLESEGLLQASLGLLTLLQLSVFALRPRRCRS